VGLGEGDEVETGSTTMSQQSGARRRPTAGFTMPSRSCWKLLCGCGRCCMGPDTKMTHFAHPGGTVLEMVLTVEWGTARTIEPKLTQNSISLKFRVRLFYTETWFGLRTSRFICETRITYK
jgi:hypothetical protein